MIELEAVPGNFWIYKFHPEAEIPEFSAAEFHSVTKTGEEISVVAPGETACTDCKIEKDWNCLKVKGELDFSLVGILYEIIGPLKKNGISVFVISTFNTDYIFIKKENFYRAVDILNKEQNLRVIKTIEQGE